jgi:alpha-glucosidase
MLTPVEEWRTHGQPQNVRMALFNQQQDRPLLRLTRDDGQEIFAISPYSPDGLLAGLTIGGARYSQALGLGADLQLTSPQLNLLGQSVQVGGMFGNRVINPAQGQTAGLQAPILFALGSGRETAALFFNETRPLAWDLTANPWTVSLVGPLDPLGSLDFFVIFGEDLPAVRKTYLSLVGRPPVPPKAIFSSFVVDRPKLVNQTWDDYFRELKDRIRPLNIAGALLLGLPIDEGLAPKAASGAVDAAGLGVEAPTRDFGLLAKAKEVDLNLMLTENPYVPKAGAGSFYDQLDRQSFLVKNSSGRGESLSLLYKGRLSGLVDYSNSAAANFWYSVFRDGPMEMGFTTYFLEGGEPESYSPLAWYRGGRQDRDHSHYAWANRFSLKWMEGFWTGLRNARITRVPKPEPRLFLLTRSGLAGQGRYGAGFYYLDPNLHFLLTEGVARGGLSLSGIDYFSADVFPYLSQFPLREFNQSYAAWLARNALISSPLLIPKDFLGETWLMANLTLRQRLAPYLYSLAHQAYLTGEPVVAPLVYHFQTDPMAREAAIEAMVGPHLLVVAGVKGGEEMTSFTLPAGRWYDFYGRAVIEQAATGRRSLPSKQRGSPLAPLLLRAGAIVPSSSGNAAFKDSIYVLAFPGEEATTFDYYDDNGTDANYQSPINEKIQLRLVMTPNDPKFPAPNLTFKIMSQEGRLPGQKAERSFVVEFLGLPNYGTVTIDGHSKSRVNREGDLAESESGWFFLGDGRLIFKTKILDLNQSHELVVR